MAVLPSRLDSVQVAFSRHELISRTRWKVPAVVEVKKVKAIVRKIVAVGGLTAAFALSPSVFASDWFPMPHEILGIPTPHELLGIPAPHELIFGPDRFSRYNDGYYRDDRHYSRPYYGSYHRSYDRHDWHGDRHYSHEHRYYRGDHDRYEHHRH
jgi:hypothetical protein